VIFQLFGKKGYAGLWFELNHHNAQCKSFRQLSKNIMLLVAVDLGPEIEVFEALGTKLAGNELALCVSVCFARRFIF
jgi:hypothetical protein